MFIIGNDVVTSDRIRTLTLQWRMVNQGRRPVLRVDRYIPRSNTLWYIKRKVRIPLNQLPQVRVLFSNKEVIVAARKNEVRRNVVATSRTSPRRVSPFVIIINETLINLLIINRTIDL